MPVDYSKFDKVGDSDDDTAAPARPHQPPQQEARAAAAPVASDDSRAEIDKLKAAKRKAREEREQREAAAAAAGGGEPAAVPPPAAPTPAPTDEVVESEPLALLRRAEAIKEELATGMATFEEALTSGEAELKDISTMNGLVGKLQGLLDSVSLGDLEEGAERDDARARRKGLNSFVEEAMPALSSLRSKAAAAK
ncbi:hypothetical protein KFE25_005832 [Diacronema lutheri]|uniref:Uncharacterized protein n=2 Tax=Diacronema lutheri TaxID=2081491 RepID=A0A8J5XVH6_DIALT|nr:hypothetical protein KFE25_005832 [Diacronema lutheri]